MLNVAVIMGRLVADPELKRTPSDVAVTQFTVAVDRSYSSRGGERQTDFLDVVAWRGTAEFVCKYFTKGQMIAVDGSIQTRNWEDKNGNKRKSVEIVASNVNFCGSKRESGGSDRGSYDRGSAYGDPADSFGSAPSFAEPASAPAPAFSSGDDSHFETVSDDDLPF